MYILVASKRFKKNLRVFLKRHPDLTKVVEERLELLRRKPNHKKLKTHQLTGKLKGTLALSVTYEYRLVFTIEDEQILLLAIGSHDDVY